VVRASNTAHAVVQPFLFDFIIKSKIKEIKWKFDYYDGLIYNQAYSPEGGNRGR